MREKKLAVVVSADMTIKAFLMGHLAALSKLCKLSVLANTDDHGLLARHDIAGQVVPVPIVRPIRPLSDFWALMVLVGYFRRCRPNCVFSVTPKAGLLAMLAGAITRIPCRMHIFTGQVWATRKGFARVLLKAADRVVARLATDILVDSESQRQFLIAEGVVAPAKSSVLASGSISGVDLGRFKPDAAARLLVRGQLGIGEGDAVLLFLGRLNRDKGVLDLARAFASLAEDSIACHLLLVGPDEGGMRESILGICSNRVGRLHFVDFTNSPERYMAAADVFCLPSYREGFGSVVIEAAAVGVPAVASRIYGITDAVVDGKTGLLHDAGNVDGIVTCLERLLRFPQDCRTLGAAARLRAMTEFSAERVTTAVTAYVCSRLVAVK